MMKKLLLLLFSVSMLSSFAQVQVGTGTSLQGIPVEPFYGFSYSQSIYLQSEVRAAGTITSLQYYFDGSSLANTDTLVFYMGHTTKTQFDSVTDWIGVGGLTEVFNGVIVDPGTSGWITITLTTPFVYNNVDNLVIAAEDNSDNYDDDSDNFQSTIATNRTLRYRSDATNPDPLSPPSGFIMSFYPNVILDGITQSCPNIDSVSLANITSSSITLSWVATNSITDRIEYGGAGFTQGTGTTIIPGANPYTITSLTPDSAYDFYLRSFCSSGDSSNWVGPFTYSTPCAAVIPTYSESFVTYPASCWTEAKGRIDSALSGSTSFWTSESFANVGPQEAVDINVYSSMDEWAISPSIDLGSGTINYQLELDVALTAYDDASPGVFDADDTVALVISTDNGITWTTANALEIWDVNNQPATIGEKIVIDLTAYTGVVKFGLYAASTTFTEDNDFYFDNFLVRQIPNCPAPTALSAYNITGSAADIKWSAGAADSSWIIEYDTVGFTLGAGTVLNLSTDSAALTGLLPNTNYQVYLRSICSVGDSSDMVGPIQFTTPCTISTPDYFQDFTTYLPDCWSEAKGALTTSTVLTGAASTWFSDGFGNNGTTGSASINTYSFGGDILDWMISPSIDLGNGSTDYIVEFDIALTPYTLTSSSTLDADDDLRLVISTDNGATWSSANSLFTFNSSTAISNTGDYKVYDLTTNGYTGVVKFGFYLKSSATNVGDNDIFIDNFNVVVKPTCPKLSVINVTNSNATDVTLAWTSGLNDVSWEVEYGAPGFTQGSGTVVGAGTNPFTVTGLTATTDYDFYVRGICGVGDTSTWEGPVSGTTGCSSLIAPYIESFSTASLPICWSETGDNSWEFGSINGTTPAGFAAYGAENVADYSTGGAGTFIGMDGSDNGDGMVSSLLTPSIDVSPLTTPALTYAVFSNNITDAAQNKLIVEFYDGANWNVVDSIQQNLGPNWEERVIDLSSFTITGDVKARYTVTGFNNSGFTYHNDILIDDVQFDELPTCPKLNSITTTAGATTIDVAWTAGSNDVSWMVEYGPVGHTVGTGTIVAAGSNPYTITGLSPDVSYDIYVRGVCGAGDSSAWVGPVLDTTTPTCVKASGITALDSTGTTIKLGWNTDPSHASFIIEYGPKGFAPGTGTIVTETLNFHEITGLTSETEYDFYFKSVCSSGDTSSIDGPYTHNTNCGAFATIPYNNDFAKYTPDCWMEATGALTVSSTLVIEPSTWAEDGFGNVGTDSAARLNIYGSSADEWLITPSFDLGSNPASVFEVSYDVALTEWLYTDSTVLDADDTAAFVISTDNGATWSKANILILYNADNSPSNTGDHEVYYLNGYTGAVKFGFYGSSDASGADVDFFIDNFALRDTTGIVSIDEIAKTSQFEIFPNPNNGEFTISNKGINTLSTISIVDIQGREVYNKQQQFTQGAKLQVGVSDVNTGVYVLTISTNGVKEQHRVIIK